MRPEKPLPMVTLREFDRPMKDYWGNTIPRPVRVGKMGKSLEQLAYRRKDSLPFLRALEASAGFRRGEKVRRLAVTLYQEGLFQWVLEVQATAGKQRRNLCLTVSKDPVKFAKIARREHGILRTLKARNPEAVVSVLQGGELPLIEDRYEGTLYGYFSHFLTGYTELGIDDRHRFFLVGQNKANRLSKAESEETRMRMVEAVTSLFDPKSGSALTDIEVNSGDFMGRNDRGGVEVRLIAARNLRAGFSPAGFMKGLLNPMGVHADKPFFIIPDRVDQLVEAVLTGLTIPLGSREEALSFLQQAVKQARRKKLEILHPTITWDGIKSKL
jgi:hypothetical protein